MRVIVGHNVAWSGGVPVSVPRDDIRNIGRGIATIGYEAWHAATYPRLIDMGAKRFHRHNPAGAERGEAMDADQWVELAANWWRVRRAFPQIARLSGRDWWRSTKKHIIDKGCEATDYYGSFKADRDFVRLENNVGGWLHRALASVRPALRSGAEVGLDASSGIEETDIAFGFIKALKNGGVNCIIEAWPNKHRTHLHEFDVLMVIRQGGGGSYSSFLSHPASPWPDRLLTGEIRVMLHGAWDEDAWLRQVEIILAREHTPIISADRLPIYIEKFGV